MRGLDSLGTDRVGTDRVRGGRFDDGRNVASIAQAPAERPASSIEGRREASSRRTLQRMLEPHRGSQLRGTPMSLASVVSTAGTRDEQGRRVEAYWSLVSATIDYYLGLTEADELTELGKRLSTYSRRLDEARRAQDTRIATSLKAARAAQYRLSRLMGGGVRPLPTDVPFTGPYATRLGRVFPGGVPEEARLLNELLPLRLSELHAGVEAINRSDSWVEEVAKDSSADTSGAGIIQALELAALNRRAFVMIARDYNLQINRFTQLAAPERVDTDRLVAMLIRTARTPELGGMPTLASDGFGGGQFEGDRFEDGRLDGGRNTASLDFRGAPLR